MPLAASVFTVIATESTEGAQGAVIGRTPTERTLLSGGAARLINSAPLRGRGPRDNVDVTMTGPAPPCPGPAPLCRTAPLAGKLPAAGGSSTAGGGGRGDLPGGARCGAVIYLSL